MNNHRVEVKWHYPSIDMDSVLELSTTAKLPTIIAEILLSRQIDSPEAVAKFLTPAKQPITSPFELKGMQKAVDRIESARSNDEHIRIIGDYDVDGIAATAILYKGLESYGIKNLSYRLPNRLQDGYGINNSLIKEAKSEDVDVLITVDNGITAFDAAEKAKELGLDLIITDHHSLGDRLPQAHAVINPKLQDVEYGFYDACGSGIAFKLVEALLGYPKYMGMAALATVADIVPLVNENRSLVAMGLKELREGTHPGLTTLAKISGLALRSIRTESLAFQLAPRINASGRIGTGKSALKLLLSDSEVEAELWAKELEEINLDRRKIEQNIFEEALSMLVDITNKNKSIVLAQKGWHPGVIGIVASRLQNRFSRPVVLIAIGEDGLGRSSARSIKAVNLFDAFSSCKDLFVKFGGHHMAAGMTIETANIDRFKVAFEAYAKQCTLDESPIREVTIDAVVSFSAITHEFIHQLDWMEPFGQSNPTPVLSTNSVELVPHSLRVLNGNHLKCAFKESDITLQCIGFQMGNEHDWLKECEKVDIAYMPKINEWRGQTSIQLQLVSLQAVE
jgi:single-stranded-DNA-specific exonuclease